MWVTRVFADVASDSGPDHVLLNPVNFRGEVKSLTYSGREF